MSRFELIVTLSFLALCTGLAIGSDVVSVRVVSVLGAEISAAAVMGGVTDD